MMLIWTHACRPRTSTFLLLDRDGVLNADRPDYVKKWEEFTFYPDSLTALRHLHELGVNTILISNQSALHRGFMDWGDFWEMHHRMVHHIEEAGGELLAAFYCPHRPDEGCCCRKPAPGMILAASRLYGFQPREAVYIGDRLTDLEAARRAGCTGILLQRASEGEVALDDPASINNLTTYATLLDAVQDLPPS